MLEGIRHAVLFAAHTDDEMVCAGTLHRLARLGCRVHLVTFAPAATRDDRLGTAASVAIVRPEWQRSLEVIGATGDFLAWTPSVDAIQQNRQKACQFVFNYVESWQPDACFILSPEDENPAHRVLGEECERVLRGRVPWTIRCNFAWNYSIGRPNLFVRLEEPDLAAKRAVIEAYRSQHFRYQYADMLTGYCRADGLSVKAEYAERFEVLRGVV